MSKVGLSVLIGLCVVGLVPMTGCRSDDGLTGEQRQQADRLDEVAKSSDGDWNKVSQADRDYILKNITSGDERAAQMLLKAKAGKIGGHPGGPPGK